MKDWLTFSAVKEAVSVEAVLRHYGVAGLRRHEHQLVGCCPIHQGKRDDSFRASLSKNVFHCFACDAHGDVLDFVAAMEKCSVREAALRLRHWFGVARAGARPLISPQRYPGGVPKVELVREKEGCNRPLGFALTGIDYAHPYLMQRGIDRATAMAFGVGFYGGPGLMRGRIVIPIRNEGGEIVAYAGRASDGSLPKYKLPSGFRKAWELFNLQRARATGSRTVILVEGYFDCMRVHQAGFPWTVALMGCSLSLEQERVLVKLFERVLLMLDGDVAGQAATCVIRAQLGGHCHVVVVPVPEGMQPDQLALPVLGNLLLR